MKLSWHRLIITTPNPTNSKYETGADKKFWTAGSQKAQMFVLNSASLSHHPHVSCFGAQAVQNARPQWRDHVNPVAPSVTSRHGRPAAAAKSAMFNPPKNIQPKGIPKGSLQEKAQGFLKVCRPSALFLKWFRMIGKCFGSWAETWGVILWGELPWRA